MNSAADLGGILIVPDTTAPVSVQIMDMGDRGPWETDWISTTRVLRQLQGTQPICLLSVTL